MTRESRYKRGQLSGRGEAAISAKVLCGYRELIIELGGDPEVLLCGAGFAPGILARPERKIAFATFAALLETSAAALACPDFGMRLASLQSGPVLMEPLERMIKNAPTFGELLAYTTRHMHIYSSAIQISLEPLDNDGRTLMRLEVLASDVPYRRQVTEQMLALAHAGAQSVSGGSVRSREIWFGHRELASTAVYHRHFGTKIRFSQPVEGVVYSNADIRSTIATSDRIVLEHELREISLRFPAHSAIHDEVKAIIHRTVVEPSCTRDHVAAVLGLHPRTLQRRLGAVGLTFEALKDEVRRDLAAHFLAQSTVTLTEVAARLGYAELAPFTRACRRWFGDTPTSLRRSLVADELGLRS